MGPQAIQPLILVVDHDRRSDNPLLSTLASHGFRTLHASARPGGVWGAVGCRTDLVLLDLRSWRDDIASLMTDIRGSVAEPILAIVPRARRERVTAVIGAGASDAIARPFALPELLARIEVWLRHKRRAPPTPPVPREPARQHLRIDPDRRTLTIDGRELHMTPIERKLLLALALRQGRAMTEQELTGAIWGADGACRRAGQLRAQVRRLRLKLEKDPARPRFLVGKGEYRLDLE
jgi:two-component system KDP operon response regulator KdpE